MEERQKSQKLIALIRRSTGRFKITRLASFDHHRVGNDVTMGQHHALGVASRSRRVNQECEVFRGILRFCSSVFCRPCRVDDTCEMLRLMRWVSLVAHKNDLVQRDASLLRSLLRVLDERQLCDNGSGSGILQLKDELFHGVVGIGRRKDTSSPCLTVELVSIL